MYEAVPNRTWLWLQYLFTVTYKTDAVRHCTFLSTVQEEADSQCQGDVSLGKELFLPKQEGTIHASVSPRYRAAL